MYPQCVHVLHLQGIGMLSCSGASMFMLVLLSLSPFPFHLALGSRPQLCRAFKISAKPTKDKQSRSKTKIFTSMSSKTLSLAGFSWACFFVCPCIFSFFLNKSCFYKKKKRKKKKKKGLPFYWTFFLCTPSKLGFNKKRVCHKIKLTHTPEAFLEYLQFDASILGFRGLCYTSHVPFVCLFLDSYIFFLFF